MAVTGNISQITLPNGNIYDIKDATARNAIANLPEPMVFKGSLGTGGTITSLPVDGSATVGDTYKVITAGTYASLAADVGDTFICDSKTSSANTWTLIPSGDEPTGTVTSVGVSGTSPISVSGSPITSSGTISISHANSGATAGSYGDSSDLTPGYGSTFKVPYVTVNTTGHVTGISEHTVKIPASDNTDTKVTSASNHYTPSTESYTPTSGSWTWGTTSAVTGITKDSKGHITGVTTTTISNPNTDVKVTQSKQNISGLTGYRPLIIFGGTASSSIPTSSSFASYTGSEFIFYNLYALPSSGSIFCTNLGASGNEITNAYLTNINGVAVGSSPKFTDSNVYQSDSTTTAYRPIMLGQSSTTSITGAFSATTNQIYQSTALRMLPSSGNILTLGSIRVGATSATSGCTMQYDSTEQCIKFVF